MLILFRELFMGCSGKSVMKLMRTMVALQLRKESAKSLLYALKSSGKVEVTRLPRAYIWCGRVETTPQPCASHLCGEVVVRRRRNGPKWSATTIINIGML